MNAASASSLPPLPSSSANQLTLKFRQAAQYGQHQSAVRRSCVGPRVGQRAESGSSLRYRIDYVEKVACRAGEPIKPGHKQGVAYRNSLQRARQLLALCFGSTCRLAINPPGSCRAERSDLGIESLPVRADAGVSDNHSQEDVVASRQLCKYLSHRITN
jgi:hypothetical protein